MAYSATVFITKLHIQYVYIPDCGLLLYAVDVVFSACVRLVAEADSLASSQSVCLGSDPCLQNFHFHYNSTI